MQKVRNVVRNIQILIYINVYILYSFVSLCNNKYKRISQNSQLNSYPTLTYLITANKLYERLSQTMQS